MSALTSLALLGLGAAGSAQYAERGATLGSDEPGVDVSGRSIKAPRIRAVHTEDADTLSLEGGTAYLIRKDPFLAYQLGRNLNFREFRPRDGVFNATISGFGGPMVDGTTAKITSNNQVSCLGCHNLPNGNPGGGTNFAKDSGRGRQAPHYFGAGVMEMLAIQVRADLMAQLDTDGDGWISVGESQAAPAQLLVTPGAGADPIDYGSAALSEGTTGTPQLNHIFRVWYGLDDGESIAVAPGASAVDGEAATHWNFEMVVWGWGQRVPASALNPTNRAFLWDPWVSHGGLEAHDPSTLDDPDGDGVSEPTLSGAIQFPATHRAPDAGETLDAAGFSLDDPDGDGYLCEISEGDLDLAEFFMLNAPKPAFAGSAKEYARGVKLLDKLDCTSCHVADWTILAQQEGQPWAGDRRLFDYDVRWVADSKKSGHLEGALLPLWSQQGDTYTPLRGSAQIAGLFSDLRHHDMGDALVEVGYDGCEVRVWRTAPLWGVGSGFPWNHDGASLTLEDAILRHGGAAQESRDKFAKLGASKRRKVVAFLDKLRLYDIESLPGDVDGDGVVSAGFMVAGVDTGTERFNAEWLFRTPVQIQGPVLNADGVEVLSFAALNLVTAYGLDLPLRVDADEDGWPEVWDADDLTPGFKDGLDD